MAGYSVRETKINIPQDEIEHFRQMLTTTRFPELPIVPGADEDRSTYGTKLSDFKDAKERLLWKHFLVEIEGAQIHFVHEKSKRADAIPLLILHGWPFSFWEYKYLIEPLTNPPAGQPAFHVVLPSLPGIFLSSIIPNKQHSTPDVARVFNTLMVDVLGYPTYGAHGGDFGAINLRQVQLN
ncbi:peptidase S33 family protein, partial [Pleurotus pulmonarius]